MSHSQGEHEHEEETPASHSDTEEDSEVEMDNGADEQTATQHTQGAAQQDALAAAPAAAPASAGAGTGGTDELTFDRDAVQSSTPGLLFRVGDIIDVQDTANSWYLSRVLAIRRTLGEPEIQVHYMGWPARWDEFIRASSSRLAPQNSRSNGAQGPSAEPIIGPFPTLATGAAVGPLVRGSIRAGDIIDARDTEQNWYLSTVLDTREDFGEVRVHFNGWSSDWDEWIPVGSERLAARGSRSGGATGPDMEHDQAARSALAGAFPGSASKFAPSATSYAFDALMQPREVRPKPARNPAAAAAAAPAAAAASSSSFSFTFGVVPAGGFNFAPPPALPAPEEDPFGTFGEAPPTALTAATAVVSVTAASPVVPTSNPTGFAVRKKHEAVPLYVSASAMAPVSPPAPSFLDAPSFVRTSQQSLLSRVMLARLVHATERASSGFASADRFKEGLEIVHRILTGEARPAPQQRSAGVAFGGVSATFGGEAFVLPNELSPPPAAAATSAGTTSSSSFEIVNAPTPVGAAGIAASSPNASALPALSFFDSSRTTVLQRLIQFYSILDDRELRVGFMAYLPLIRSRLIGSPDSNNLGERPYDVDHADSAGRTTLHWIAMAPMTPRPGGFLFCMMELLLSLGANPSALTNAGESCMQLLVQNAQGSFDLVAPLITLLRKHGAVMTETDEQRNTILHRILSGGRISLGLLEECILSALTGGFDLFAANSAGQTVFSLVRLQQSLRPHDPEIRLALEMLGAFAEQWMWEVAPWVRNSLENQGIDRDCAAIIEQYVSGSGKPFDTSDTDPSGAGSQQLLKPLKLKHWQDFAVGDLVDALDTANKWYESTVIGVRADAVQIHYNGWGSRWDEWVPRGSPRLAQRGTHVHAIIPAGSLVPEMAAQGRGEI